MTKYEIMKRLVSAEPYRYSQILSAIFKRGILRFSDMRELPRGVRDSLSEARGESVLSLSPLKSVRDGQAEKLLFGLSDGGAIETVALEYARGWRSFCISSQVGCAFGCRFCATGTMGFSRNLAADEITDQLLYFSARGMAIDSVSFMGMGEPLSNPEVFGAMRELTDPEMFGLSQRRITVSTVGIPTGIERLSREFPQVNIALSLHAPTDALRRKLMPISGKYSIESVMSALDAHIERTHRRVFLAYTMLKGFNDGEDAAHELCRLIERRDTKKLYRVDLIPFNGSARVSEFEPSTRRDIQSFMRVLRRRNISVSVRTQFGSGINAACGQLATMRDGEKE